MKKFISSIVAISLVFFILSACSTPTTEQTKEIGTVAEWDYGIAEIKDAVFYQENNGTKMIRVNFKFTNPNSDPIYFISAFSVKAFQNGVELDDMINYDINSEEGRDLIREIMDGASLDVFSTFVLRDDSPVEVRVCTATASEDLLAKQTFTQ